MKLVAAVAIPVLTLLAQQAEHPARTVSAIRHWATGDTLRVAIEISGDFDFHSDRLHNPERIYFDIPHARPNFDSKRLYSEDVDSPLVKRIRVAETVPGVTRVVFDLNGTVEVGTSHLRNPNRLVVEFRSHGTSPATSAAPPVTDALPETAPKPPLRQWTPPDSLRPRNRVPDMPTLAPSPVVWAYTPPPEPFKVNPLKPDPPIRSTPPPAPLASKPATLPLMSSETRKLQQLSGAGGPGATEDAKPARRTAAGTASLTRALGLKLNRVVIDPGHGGHDQGTAGPHGLIEKELVLDVSLRLGKLIEQQLGAEVLYTRVDDSFVALDRRPQFANEVKADLFLSVHANSSPLPATSGVETYILNFTDSRSALDFAMRENAGSQLPMSERTDLIQKISAHDKAQESREFAEKLQAALFAFSSKNFPGEFNRNVKQAPFVVLVGTTMPAVLTEIGFVTNAKEEALLKKPDYRQKLAEAIYRGVARYAESLSHFQVAQVPSGN